MNKTLTKADIVEEIRQLLPSKRPHREVKEIVDTLLTIMSNALQRENFLLLTGFGKFTCVEKKARQGRNPHTNEVITLPSRKVIGFHLSRLFKDELNG
ncbi:MAG: HU family DNA-binding protein [Desulfovibrio sp.]|nr:HU family DNA-binding protein [Desulfovibrio sp.]